MAPCHPLRRQLYVLIRFAARDREPSSWSASLPRRLPQLMPPVPLPALPLRGGRNACDFLAAGGRFLREATLYLLPRLFAPESLAPEASLTCACSPPPRLPRSGRACRSRSTPASVSASPVRQLPSRLRIVKAQPSPGQPPLQPQHLARPMQASRNGLSTCRSGFQLPPRQPPILPRAQLHALQRWFRPAARVAAPGDRDRRHGGRRVTPQVRLRRRRQSGHYGSAERAVYYTEREDSELAATTRSLEAWPKSQSGGHWQTYRCAIGATPTAGPPGVRRAPRPGWRCCANSRRIRKWSGAARSAPATHRGPDAIAPTRGAGGRGRLYKERFHGFPYVVSQFRPRGRLE